MRRHCPAPSHRHLTDKQSCNLVRLRYLVLPSESRHGQTAQGRSSTRLGTAPRRCPRRSMAAGRFRRAPRPEPARGGEARPARARRGGGSARRAAPPRHRRTRDRPYRPGHRPVPPPASPPPGHPHRPQQPRQPASGARPVAGGDRVLRGRPRPRFSLHLRVLQPRARAAAHERPGPRGALPAPGGRRSPRTTPRSERGSPVPSSSWAGRRRHWPRRAAPSSSTPTRRTSGTMPGSSMPTSETSTPPENTIAPRSTSRSRSVSPRSMTRTRNASAPRSATATRTGKPSATSTSRSARSTTTAARGRPPSRTTSAPIARSRRPRSGSPASGSH